jgi:hypothetical protein
MFNVHGPSRTGDAQPLWTARVDIVQLHQPSDHWAFRAMYVAPKDDTLLAPGTVAALCFIRRVDIHIGAQRHRWNEDPDKPVEAVLLLQFAPGDWEPDLLDNLVDVPDCTCVAGEVTLSQLVQNAGDPDWRAHFTGILDSPANPTVHSSGLSLEGKARMPWEKNPPLPTPARWHVMLPFVSETASLMVELDRDRLTDAAAADLIASFQNLDNAFQNSGGVWAQLRLVNHSIVPQFHWDLTPPAATFLFGPGEVSLAITGSDIDTVATSSPRAAFSFDGAGQLLLKLNGFTPGVAAEGHYTWTAAAEKFHFEKLVTAYDAVQEAAFLRGQLALDEPALPKPDPQVLWGCVPLEDGWAQLPFFNVSSSVYAAAFPDLGIPTPPAPGPLSGTASYGNESAPAKGEQVWNVILLRAGDVQGQWTFDATKKIAAVDLRIIGPDMELNGFLWLATESPSRQDALPSLDNWLRALRMVALRSSHPDDPEPSPHVATFSVLDFERQASSGNPLLTGWSFTLDANPASFDKLVTAFFGDVPDLPEAPLAWRRHPALPAVQTLPLTQSLDPPAYPSPSRQLAPFVLATDNGKPKSWAFTAATGTDAASAWATFTGGETPFTPLSLAALSLPGLSFEPSNGPIAGTFLSVQYRHGLPYLDEIYALSQLSKPKPADAAALPPPPPLTRDRYADHWANLAEKAVLAAAQNDPALVPFGGQTAVQGLVEPLVWPVKPSFDEAAYPGKLTLTDGNAATTLTFLRDTSLAGFDGGFNARDAQTITLAADASTATFLVTGGSLNAQGAGGTVRDQRGLLRSATAKALSGALETPLTSPDGTRWLLRSVLAPLSLEIDGATKWGFWFRDLPAAAADQHFLRDRSRSKAARGVNDPASLSPAWVHLNGYEWRMGPGGKNGDLPLLGYSFYPLTLELVEFDADASVTALEVVGRLLFSWAVESQESNRANAVRLRFERTGGVLALKSVAAEDIDPDRDALAVPSHAGHKGEWPLGVDPDAPRLFWDGVALTADAIVLTDAVVDFFFFGKRWVVPISFGASPAIAPITPAGSDPVRIAQAELTLDPRVKDNTTLALELVYRWGNTAKVFIEATEKRYLVGTGADSGPRIHLSGPSGSILALKGTGESLEGSVQIEFSGVAEAAGAAGWQLLPGMQLDAGDPIRGCGTMTFVVNGFPNAQPITMQAGFAEALIRCKWGESLQEPGGLTAARFFGSSAGSIAAGFSCASTGGAWTDSLLLNGLLELKNLVSWPRPDLALSVNGANVTSFTVPALRGATQAPLDHARHTLRLLFDQHEIPEALLAAAGKQQIFTLAPGTTWKTLALAEHQLVNVQMSAAAAGALPSAVSNDRRWTVLQTVQISATGAFTAFLAQMKTKQTTQTDTDAVQVSAFQDASALYGGKLLDLLPAEIARLNDSLIVEASGAGWIRQRASDASFTPLEFLPGSTPGAALTGPSDLSASPDVEKPEWLLASVPFLGRMTPATLTTPPLLGTDPIVFLAQARTGAGTINELPLLLANWADHSDRKIQLSLFDLAGLHEFDRLDPASLEESLFRLATPPAETASQTLVSILATLPTNGPSRLARPSALIRVYDSHRYSLPPSVPDPSKPVPPAPPEQVFLIEGFAQSAGDYTLFFAGAVLIGAPFSAPERTPGARYYPAVRLIPPVLENTPEPVSLAVSPYLGLKRFAVSAPPGPSQDPILVYGELLGTTPSGQLDVLARQLWFQGQTHDVSQFHQWATDTLSRFAPDSRAGLLRLREVMPGVLADGTATASAAYSFERLRLTFEPPLARVAHPVRTQLQRLRYAEGQFGGTSLPAPLADFEVAPPQVRDVQPVRLEHRPARDDWPWGVSLLRLRVRYTELAGAPAGVVGLRGGTTLWWQGCAHPVQFQVGEEAALELPPLFRAPSIQSLVPALPGPGLPVLNLQAEASIPDDAWQPLLPGTADCLVDGARPGAGFVLRSHLQRQTNAGVDLSGGIPVQHRMPRPVPLRPNLTAGREFALRTWANYFDPERLLVAGLNPCGTAFIAPVADDLKSQPDQRLVRLVSPPGGVIPADWNGVVEFDIQDQFASNWAMTVRIETAAQSVPFAAPPAPVQKIWKPGSASALKTLLASLAHGDPVSVTVGLEYLAPPVTVRGYHQKLAFPLLAAKPGFLPLPLAPVFAVFEDPEYNRALVSQTSHSEGIFVDGVTPHRILLSLDRREYNPNSRFYVLYVDQSPVKLATASLLIQAIPQDGVPRDLATIPVTNATLTEQDVTALYAGVGMQPVAGDSISCTLRAGVQDVVTVRVDIVAEPVTPAPQAAYGLLRKSGNAVECVRFAWSPAASSIELVNPDDLLGETVRRRAVFSWLDTNRAGRSSQYGVQKVAAGGSTHSIEDTLWVTPE